MGGGGGGRGVPAEGPHRGKGAEGRVLGCRVVWGPHADLGSPPEGRTSSAIVTWEAALDGLPTAVRRAELGGGCHPRWAPGSGVSPPRVGGDEEYGGGGSTG